MILGDFFSRILFVFSIWGMVDRVLPATAPPPFACTHTTTHVYALRLELFPDITPSHSILMRRVYVCDMLHTNKSYNIYRTWLEVTRRKRRKEVMFHYPPIYSKQEVICTISRSSVSGKNERYLETKIRNMFFLHNHAASYKIDGLVLSQHQIGIEE